MLLSRIFLGLRIDNFFGYTPLVNQIIGGKSTLVYKIVKRRGGIVIRLFRLIFFAVLPRTSFLAE